jgi:hypothetical protein
MIVTEEAAKVATTTIEALKQTPAILALVIFNLLFMGSVVYIQHSNGERWGTLLELTLKQCTGVQK